VHRKRRAERSPAQRSAARRLRRKRKRLRGRRAIAQRTVRTHAVVVLTRPLRTWFNKVARRRGKKTATVALARRLLVIAYHVLRNETDYDAARLKRNAA